MTGRQLYAAVPLIVSFTGCMALALIAGCGDQSTSSSPQMNNQVAVVATSAADVSTLPKKGKVMATKAPAKAVFGMIYVDTTTGKEYIFDGAQWVPHDQSVDQFYQAQAAAAPAPKMLMTQTDVCVDGDPACTPTGAHGGAAGGTVGHSAIVCTACHKLGGRLVFNSAGPAYGVGLPIPTFDATTKTCSNIACHKVPSGTFSYYFPGGDGEPVQNTVSYGGGAPGVTPSWYATGADACNACHGNPPRNGSNGSNVWHSGYHGGQGPTGAYNQCQFCHPDASSSKNNGIGDTITNATMHANGAVNVQARFTSACFGCH